MHYRRARPQEWRVLRDLRFRAIATDPSAFDSTLERERARPDEAWAAWTRAGDCEARFVAEDATGRLVGIVGARVDDDGPVEVFGMWVAPEARKRGVGGGLLDAALAWARDAWPERRVGLWVSVAREDAKRLYASRGFRATGRVEAFDHRPGDVGERMERDAA